MSDNRDPKPIAKHSRQGYTPYPVDPSKFKNIKRPSNTSLRGAIVTGFILWTLLGGTIGGMIYFFFNQDATDLYLPAAIGAVIAVIIGVRHTIKDGRKRREDFIRCGGDPTGMTDMMFGMMRGYRTPDGKWEVPEQGSGDYQGI